MAQEIILSDESSDVLEYIEITNSGLGTVDGAKEMLIITDYNPNVPVVRPPYIAENVANKKNDLNDPNAINYASTIAVYSAISGLTSNTNFNDYTGNTKTLIDNKLDIDLFNYYSGTTIPDNYYNKNQIDILISGSTSGLTSSWLSLEDKPSWLSGTTQSIFESGHTHNQYVLNDDFSGYTGNTETIIENKLDTTIFDLYTGTTASNLYVTGGTNGLSKINNNVVLGGTLNENTEISLKKNVLTLRSIKDDQFNIGSGFSLDTNKTIIQSNGKLLVIGYFSTYNGISKNKIVSLNLDGSVDNTFNVGTGFNPSTVSDIQIAPDNKIVISGYLGSYNGDNVNNVARFNTDGTIDIDFHNNSGSGPNTTASNIAIQTDGKIIFQGNSLNSYNGTPITGRMGRINIDGTLDTAYVPAVGASGILRIQSDDKLLTRSVLDFVRLNVDGTLDLTFTVGDDITGAIYAIEIQSDGKILLGGDITLYNGNSVNYILRLNSDGTFDNTFNFTPTSPFSPAADYIWAIKEQTDGKILVGGSFTSVALTNGLVRLNSDGSIDNTFDVGSGFYQLDDPYVNDIQILSNGNIIICGGFTSYNSTPCNHIVELNPDGTINILEPCNAIINFVNNGIEYNGDYSEYYSNRSLPDKNYVDKQLLLKLNTATFNIYSGTTIPNTYYNKAEITNLMIAYQIAMS